MDERHDAPISYSNKYNNKLNQFLYMVGETLNYEIQSWNFQGVYSTEEKAVDKCIEDNFFIARIEVDFDEPRDMIDFDYAYYPRLEDKPLNKWYMKNKILTFIHNNLAKPKVRMWLLFPLVLYPLVLIILEIFQKNDGLNISGYTLSIYFTWISYLIVVVIIDYLVKNIK